MEKDDKKTRAKWQMWEFLLSPPDLPLPILNNCVAANNCQGRLVHIFIFKSQEIIFNLMSAWGEVVERDLLTCQLVADLEVLCQPNQFKMLSSSTIKYRTFCLNSCSSSLVNESALAIRGIRFTWANAIDELANDEKEFCTGKVRLF